MKVPSAVVPMKVPPAGVASLGRAIFEGADEGDKWKIAILPADGGDPINTFAVPAPFYQVIRWTADSEAFTYLDSENGAQNVWQQPLDGSAPVKLTSFTDNSILHYDWSSSQRLILSRGGRRRDIVLIKNID